MPAQYDFTVVGAGFFGVRLALQLAEKGLRVALLEKGPSICRRASYINQARIHNGYHYPRSLSTALGSHKHYDRFCREMEGCIDDTFEHIYAIAREGSYTNAYQFQQFCRTLGLPLKAAGSRLRQLFDWNHIEDVFVVVEGAFNARAIRRKYERLLDQNENVTLLTNTTCNRIDLDRAVARLETSGGGIATLGVFIVTYAETNNMLLASGLAPLDLKAEITEVCLVDVPDSFRHRGVTVMDGPYFSCMPMPAEACHSLTHVSYTPHVSWSLNNHPDNPDRILACYPKKTRFMYMLKDTRRYLPRLEESRYRGSLFEVKVVPSRNEVDDGRPILFRMYSKEPACISVLGSKIDSIFELEDAVDEFIDGWGGPVIPPKTSGALK